MGISLLCSFGTILFLEIPLIYGLGSLILGIFNFFISRGAVDKQKEFQPKEQKALMSYIQQARNLGRPNEDIAGSLRANGWAEDDIKWGIIWSEPLKSDTVDR